MSMQSLLMKSMETRARAAQAVLGQTALQQAGTANLGQKGYVFGFDTFRH